MHTPASIPHRISVGSWVHVAPLQQPAHVDGLQLSQVPASQCPPLGHAAHVEPAAPQAM